MTEDPLWTPSLGIYIFQCGTCGTTLYQADLELCSTKEEGDLCPSCLSLMRREDVFENDLLVPLSVGRELGFCECGDYTRLDALMLLYLQTVQTGLWGEKADHDTMMLLAYLADQIGWTDHGHALPAAWLTEKGKKVLLNLEKICSSRLA